MNKEQIILFNGNSQHGSLNFFVQDLQAAFTSLGYHALILNLCDPGWPQELQQALNRAPIKFFLGLNGWSITLQLEGKSIFDALNIPLVMWFFDHPYYHFGSRLVTEIENVLFAFVFENGYHFAKQFVAKPNPKMFLPHAGSAAYFEPLPFQNRPLQAVFFGSMGNLEELESKLKHPDKKWNSVIWNTLESGKTTEDRQLHEILFEQFIENGIDYTTLDGKYLFTTLLAKIDQYLRIYKRKQFIQSIQSFPITVVGNGWEQLRQENLQIHSSRDFKGVLDMMNHTQVLLNNLTPFYSGGHERLFYGMLQGAACLTDWNPWLEREFQADQHLCFYAQDLTDVEAQLNTLFQNPQHLEAIAHQGRQRSLEAHTWQARAETLIRWVESHG